MAIQDINVDKLYGEIMDTFVKNEEGIIKGIYPNEKVRHGQLTPTLLRNYGGMTSAFFKLVNAIPEEKREQVFMVTYFSQIPKTYKGAFPPWVTTTAAYNFLKDAKIESVPLCFLPSGSRMLFLEWIEGMTLISKMRELDEEGQRDILIQLNKALARFQYKSTKHSANLSEYMKKKIFAGRTMEEKAREYFTKTIGGVDSDLIKAYKLISRAHDGFCVVHGDLSHTNIIIAPDGTAMFVDPELALGDGINDVGSILAYLGIYINLKHIWDEIGLHFKKSKLELIVQEGGGKIEDGNGIPLSEETKKFVLYELYASIFHKSFKILAKNQTSHLFDENCEVRLKKQMGMILGEFIAHQEKFALPDKDVEAAKFLLAKYAPLEMDGSYNGPPKKLEETLAVQCG